MSDIQLLKDKLLDDEWYKNHLSLSLRNSFGTDERVETYTAILKNINTVGVNIGKMLDITNTNYFTEAGIDPSATVCPILDFLASILGVSRKFRINYTDTDNILGGGTGAKSEDITLTNMQLRLYLFVQTLKNNFQGTNEELLKLYNNNVLVDLGIKYIWNNTLANNILIDPLHCDIYFTNYSAYLDTNPVIIKLFLGGYLTIESLGIIYRYKCTTRNYIGAFFGPSSLTNYVQGYYYNSKFYSDPSHTTEITGSTDTLYRDIPTNLTYTYNGTSYVQSDTYYAIFDTDTSARSSANYCIFTD